MTTRQDAGSLPPGAACQPARRDKQTDRASTNASTLLPEQAAARGLHSVALLPGFAGGVVAGVVRPD
jgi:hypothetical protein